MFTTFHAMNKPYFEFLTATVFPVSPKTNVNVFNRKIKYRKEEKKDLIIITINPPVAIRVIVFVYEYETHKLKEASLTILSEVMLKRIKK